MQKQIELLRKLKALAERGVDGEKVNAQAQLEKLMKKYGITLAEIEGESINQYFFKADGINAKLLNQCAKRVKYDTKCYSFPASKVKEYRLEGNFMIECTTAEYIEIDQMYVVYKRLFEKESETFFTAFLTANDFLTIVTEDQMRSVNDLSEEERKEHFRTLKMAQNINKETIRKQLEN